MKNFAEFVDAVAQEFWSKPTYEAEDGSNPQSLHSAAREVSVQLTDIDALLSMVREVHHDSKVNVQRFGKHDGPAGDTMVEYLQIVLAIAAQVRLTADEADANDIKAEEQRRYDAARG